MIVNAYLPAVMLASTAVYLLGIRGVFSLVENLIVRGEMS